MCDQKINITTEILTTSKLYKNCEAQLTDQCYGLSLKENYRGKLCINCYNVKQSIYMKKRNEEKKKLKLKKVQLSPDQIIKLSQAIGKEQMLQILDAEQIKRVTDILETIKISETKEK